MTPERVKIKEVLNEEEKRKIKIKIEIAAEQHNSFATPYK